VKEFFSALLGDNEVYHVLNRGNGRAEVFHKPGDFSAFVKLIGEAKGRYPVKVIAYCLMSNHFHLLVKPIRGEDLSKWMQWLMTTHVWRYHRHHGTSGHIWQGRFKSFIVQQDDHLLTAIRYVEGEPGARRDGGLCQGLALVLPPREPGDWLRQGGACPR
jgi:putative transposase